MTSKTKTKAKRKPRRWRRWARVFTLTGDLALTLETTKSAAEDYAKGSSHPSEIIKVIVQEVVKERT